MAPIPYAAYRKAQAATSSQAELVVLLYRGAVRFAAKARIHLENEEWEAAHNSLLRAQEILVELMIGFKPEAAQVAADIFALHNYIYDVLYQANMQKDGAQVDEALRHLRDLLATWEQIALPQAQPPTMAGVVPIDRRC